MSRSVVRRETLTVVVAALATLVGAPACAWFGGGASTVHLASGPRNPASQGEVKTKLTSDRNTQVTVTVKHLAPPGKIAQGATTYVVWVRPIGVPAARGERSALYPERQPVSGRSEDGVYNLGGLKISGDLDGKLETITPFHSFELFITAEPSSFVTTPNGERVLWTTIMKE